MDPQKHSEEPPEKAVASPDAVPIDVAPSENMQKGRWERSWPTIACGAGLFSDGYLNGVIGSVNTILGKIYPDSYSNSPASQNVSSITFAGTVLGQLVFGYVSDHWSRKWSLMISTIILIIFSALCAGAYGLNGSQYGLFAALTAYRFFLGIGIGGEYPAGSVAAAENTGELKKGHRNRWFIMFTNFQIDFAYVVSALVPMILVLICTENHLRLVWRIALGLGTVVSLIWFIYDFSAYSFNIYSSKWVGIILGDSAPLWKTFGWTTVTNAFYIPGSFLGALVSDWIGPRNTLAIGVGLQGVIGFVMSGCYEYLSIPKNVAGFVFGPGDNIGLCAAKSSATAIRGQYYAIAAAAGKIGAFVGTYVIPIIQKNAPNEVRSGQDPFFVSSSLCLLSAAMAYFLLPHIGQV
ncbi:unnamed protein product [Aspergillus oryzae]|uniref:Unnamed protein product n=2 Tax=Aspergillus oryzae TaxID=5062 RepID=A0AAN4YHB5_ASPOZ|nr:unnamed protein product [Aspergillus oryzae]GMF92190.1 unnamed protein product [Aspergillus oryzae]GMG00890.1 unnamed protein product [Aspergillus oryzae]GMG26723.1 unnamed protein product [Aspergillus oryzae]GMG52927.1 unnamed protein product [Aspergillus oryzae var. brunneus]